ncbi:extracellular catalytic domain type 1 short-chain-length polyhydroxyalkanoate depolymerase [Thiohalocapsa marina]|nr:PHB depolymerase family esterase [Thiohalocapsa marina]
MTRWPKIDLSAMIRRAHEGLPASLFGLFDRLKALHGGGPPEPSAGASGTPPAFVPPPGARFETHCYRGTTGQLDYKLYRPSGDPEVPRPLVVMLHGCTQSADDFAAGTGMNGLAEAQSFLVAYPEQSTSANATQCWNWFRPGDQVRGGGEPALIAGAIRDILRDYPVDPTRVYVAGLSAGGAEALIMGLAYPELFAAIGIHSGVPQGVAHDLPSALELMRAGAPPQPDRPRPTRRTQDHPAPLMPTILFHGDGDTLVHPANASRIIEQIKDGARLRTHTNHGRSASGIGYSRIQYLDVQGTPLIEHWILHGVGHAWSGGSPAGSYTEPRGPDAGREMLRFFSLHQRRNMASCVHD